MANESAKDRRLIAYLLGQLPEAERTEIEDRYFAEDATFEYLAAVETELIDGYVRGELPEPDRAQFEQRFLEAPRLRARVEFARQLQARAVALLAADGGRVFRPGATRETVQQEIPQPEKPRPVTPQPAGNKSVSPLVAAACIGAVAAGVGGWWVFQSGRPSAAETVQAVPAPPAEQHLPVSMPIARPQPTPVSLTTPPAGPVDLVLAQGRDSSAVLTLSPTAEVVRIQIDHDGPVRERYAVIVATRDRHRVWTESSLASRTPDAKSVILQMPAASLPAGEYLLTLSGGPLQARRLEFVADYSLHVR